MALGAVVACAEAPVFALECEFHAAFPEGDVGDAEGEITVIREELAGFGEECARGVEVFDDIRGDDDVEDAVEQVGEGLVGVDAGDGDVGVLEDGGVEVGGGEVGVAGIRETGEEGAGVGADVE